MTFVGLICWAWNNIPRIWYEEYTTFGKVGKPTCRIWPHLDVWLVYVTESVGGKCRVHLEIFPAKLSKLILIAWCFTRLRVCLRPTKPNQATQSIVNKRAQIHCCPMLGNLQRKIFFRGLSTGGRNTCQVKLHLLSSLSEVTVKSNKLGHPLQLSEKNCDFVPACLAPKERWENILISSCHWQCQLVSNWCFPDFQ